MNLAAPRFELDDDAYGGGYLPPRRILVVIDPTTHEQPALDKAVRIAARCGGSLELYVCDVEQQLAESWAGGARFDEYRELRRQRLVAELDALAQPLRKRGLPVEVICEWHAPLEQGIGHHAIRTRPDLVVKETHRHAQLPAGSVNYTDWNLIRQLPVPLLLVHARPWQSTVHVAAAIDPCHPADRPVALDTAILADSRAFARLFEGTMDVFHVLQMPAHLPGDPVSLEQVATEHARIRNAVAQLAQVAETAVHFIQDLIPDGLVRLAETRRPDVLVVGAVARLRSAHATAGGMAARILERVDCDLLVVKPPGFVSPLLVTSE